MPKLGKVLRDARKAKGLSLRQLEADVGVSNAHLSQLETGVIEKPSMALLFSLSEALDLDYANLLDLAGYTEPLKRTPGRGKAVGVALAGVDDLSPGEADELRRFADLLRRRRSRPQEPA
jgi:HTH-type transcriptional regulator, competence development regulator